MPELPAGTVTFLFSDIEGSTKLLKSLGARYADVLSAHQRLLRQAAAREGGHEIDTQGDAFFFVFPRAQQAVAAAASAQRALEGHEWPEGHDLRVRMGLHTGEPIVGEDRYVGLGVHRGARICAAGHGGQVLLSNATRELLEDDPEGEFRLRDLGEHRLKDIDRPERLFQLLAPGLQEDFPPIRTLTTQGETPFAGREGDLAAEAAETMAVPAGRRRRLVVLGAAVGVLVAAALVLAFALRSSPPEALVAPPNSVAIVSTADAVVEDVVQVGKGPGLVAVGDKAAWVANLGDGTVSRIDLATRKVQDFGIGFEPSALAFGDGSLWVTDAEEGRLERRNADTGEVQKEFDLGKGGVGPAPLAVGDGSVWAANSNAFKVLQIDPRSNNPITEFRVDAPRFLAIGQGEVWVMEGANALAELDPGSGEVAREIPVDFDAGGIAVGGGSVWVTDPDEDQVRRFDSRTGSPGRPTRVGQLPEAVAFASRAVWVVNTYDGTLSEIDPERDDVVATVSVGERPGSLAATDATVWVPIGEP